MKLTDVFVSGIILAVALHCTPSLEFSPDDFDCEIPASVGPISHPLAGEFQEIIEAKAGHTLPGLAVLVESPSGLWYGSAGDVDLIHQIPWEPCQPSYVASITKNFIASTLLILEAENQVNLEDRVRDYLSEESLEGIPNSEEITIESLLNHTSGIPNFTVGLFALEFLVEEVEISIDDDQVLDLVRGQDPWFEVGSDFRYSNTNYSVAAKVIESVTDKYVGDVVGEKVLAPLALENTYYHPNLENLSLPTGYSDYKADGNLIEGISNYRKFDTGDAAIVSTIFDLRDYLAALFSNNLILSNESQASMQDFYPLSDEAIEQARQYPSNTQGNSPFSAPGYGLGLRQRIHEDTGFELWGHSGSRVTHTAMAYYIPELEATITLLSNVDLGLTQGELDEVYHEIIRGLNEEA